MRSVFYAERTIAVIVLSRKGEDEMSEPYINLLNGEVQLELVQWLKRFYPNIFDLFIMHMTHKVAKEKMK